MTTAADPLDFRSDTRTLPDARMREAMARAEAGDDVYGDDPTVALLEERAARLLGVEAALLTPTTTMANLLGPLAVAGPPGSAPPRVVVGADTHMAFLEGDGLRRFGGVDLLPVAQRADGLPDPDRLDALLARPCPTPTVVCVENTCMLRAGNALDAGATRSVAAVAHRHGARLHLDGARLANAATALATSCAELAAPADSVAFCLSKGLGAPIGGILGAARDTIAAARRLRTWLGGSLHQAGPIAAAALIALDRAPELAHDHRHAAALAADLAAVPGVRLLRAPRPTNMVMARVPGMDADTCAAHLNRRGVRVLPLPNGHIRFAVHREHDMISVSRAVAALTAVAAERHGAGDRANPNDQEET
ncbi:GntG family PLP-dependent aldolase [Streptomyces sp. NPDC051684]|uniref:GntG family PLP-dependent aldolase n=1 Tax=Streptomyces sp. NPDC051684 TaxID=3365670 RepID=UPI0037B52CF0